MGFHTLPSLRDYWSTDFDLVVTYVANVMPLKRFEEIRAFLHFNDNNLMKPASYPDYDRSFKTRLVLDRFNSSFLSAMAPTKFQSEDKLMKKFKGHNILRQFVKGKPIKWEFKL